MIRKIAVTGTKGKTTAVYLIDQLLQGLGKHTLRVDTTGHFIDGKRRSDMHYSQDIWGLVPSVGAGRYLYEFIDNPLLANRDNSIAVLECSLGSSTPSGMGYATHEVGVFLNVYEDHLGSSSRLKTKEDILDAKQFIFDRIAVGGWAVWNADDPLVRKGLARVSEHLHAQTIAFGLHLTELPESFLQDGGRLITVVDGDLVYQTAEARQKLATLADLPWTFNGSFTPSLYNAAAAAAAVIALHGGVVPPELPAVLKAVRLDPSQGRLVLFKNKAGVRILADYAHEKVSLQEVSRLARTLAAEDGKVIGVVRLAYDRTDDLIKETGRAIAPAFDSFVVYDKIDGYFKQPRTDLHNLRFQKQEIGYVSDVLAEAIRSLNPNVERIIREDHAIARAAQLAEPGDVVVVIVNDDVARSLAFIRTNFKAEVV